MYKREKHHIESPSSHERLAEQRNVDQRPNPEEAARALKSAQKGLAEAHERMGRAVQVAVASVDVKDANHFAQRLERAYKGGGKP